MPELPEVEVSRMGISPHLVGKTIQAAVIRQPKLRWMIPDEIAQLSGLVIEHVTRRAKYLLLHTSAGTIMIHLGMSGSLRVLKQTVPPKKHDHVDLLLTDGKMLRYHDPRRFGAWLWQQQGTHHKLLANLGPEPLHDVFDSHYIWAQAKGKRVAVKQFIMENRVVVGVGNIYANEALFLAGIAPTMPAGVVTEAAWERLVKAIKQVLTTAISQGGTTLKDFSQADGKPGYFAQQLQVYGRAGQPCPECQNAIQQVKIAQRNSYYCAQCQPVT